LAIMLVRHPPKTNLEIWVPLFVTKGKIGFATEYCC